MEYRGYYEKPRTSLLDLLGHQYVYNVLEIGCGGGANLLELKRRNPDCRTTGVEFRQDAADAALTSGRADNIHVGDVLNERSINFPSGEFDLIILSHVLEHFAEPGLVLERALVWLSSDGRLLIALPNIRHISVIRELLLKGDFQYRSSGILDHTHLRFFTKKSANRFLLGQGLAIERCIPDIEGRKSKLLNKLSFGIASDFAAFAYNILLIRS